MGVGEFLKKMPGINTFQTHLFLVLVRTLFDVVTTRVWSGVFDSTVPGQSVRTCSWVQDHGELTVVWMRGSVTAVTNRFATPLTVHLHVSHKRESFNRITV